MSLHLKRGFQSTSIADKVKKPPTILIPPFSQERSLLVVSRTAHPAIVQSSDRILLPRDELDQYLNLELRTSKLDDIHQYLWLAGLPRSARPLHRQRLMNRTIVITESPDEHLIWHESRIFIKPLPTFLLDHNYWQTHLCTNEEWHRYACGLVLSYAWLVSYQSDLRIATELHLLPQNVGWESWTAFIEDFLRHVNPHTIHQVDRRYQYGELRLTRLNAIYRITPAIFSLKHYTRGFMSGPSWYQAFFARNFGWLVAVFFYVSVILSAMQVGLATDSLRKTVGFRRASIGFASGSIIVVLASFVVMLLTWIFLFWYHLLSTIQYCKQVTRRRQAMKRSV
jgi:hypothetical protein